MPPLSGDSTYPSSFSFFDANLSSTSHFQSSSVYRLHICRAFARAAVNVSSIDLHMCLRHILSEIVSPTACASIPVCSCLLRMHVGSFQFRKAPDIHPGDQPFCFCNRSRDTQQSFLFFLFQSLSTPDVHCLVTLFAQHVSNVWKPIFQSVNGGIIPLLPSIE